VPWISLPSIVLGRAVVPELYQRAFTVERVSETALGLLGEPGVGTRAARAILSLISAAAPSALTAAGARA
jgi:lipid A disaccharide synthetase